ncbi:hypothetical protein [Anaerococcus sp.]|uniref:hypothetical protein n=1 Tax=Anaerococcus sp. TaxID=1872515 RepID=UPI00280A7F1B|nr:hypothetical protein [Anaerococcus sp.]MDU3176662.1 hypothetical protein [Anaerococcus sp.]
MKTIDIYYINMSPVIDKKENRSIEKSNHIKEILKNRPLYNKEKIIIDNITMFTYQPSYQQNWMKFVELYIDKEIKSECILIFRSIIDLSATPMACYSRLVNLIANDKIKEIYFTDYSLEKEVNEYAEFFEYHLKDSRIKKSYKGNEVIGRRTGYPQALKDEVVKLRTEIDPPVFYSDITNITGIVGSTLSNMVGDKKKANYKKPGRPITPHEAENLRKLMEEEDEKILNSVSRHYENYI